MIIFSCNSLFAQFDTSPISKIKCYINYIDSIEKLEYVQNLGFITSIADGIIKNGDDVIGGFGVYTLSNSKADTAFRIQYHDNLDMNIYKTYYYRSNQLLYAIVELKDWRNGMKVIYKKEEFYNDNKVIWTTLQKEKSANKYFNKTDFSLFEDGLKFIDDFKKGK